MAKTLDQKVDNDGLLELTQAILGHVHRLPGNDRCADCNSEKGKISQYLRWNQLSLATCRLSLHRSDLALCESWRDRVHRMLRSS